MRPSKAELELIIMKGDAPVTNGMYCTVRLPSKKLNDNKESKYRH